MSKLTGGSFIPSTIHLDDMPLLSVIIVTLNRAQYIEHSLINVIREIKTDYANTELIVIDGGSNDGTVDILRKYDQHITYWLSEPDSGAGDAVNKGIDLAKGEIVRLLGDDDVLIPGYLGYMVRHMVDHPDIDTLFGHGEYYQEDVIGNTESFFVNQPIGRLKFKDLFKIMPSLAPELQFSRRWVFEKYGGYDPNYRYLGCFDMWLRHAKKGVTHEVIPQVITKRIISLTSPNNPHSSYKYSKQISKEYYKILRQHGGIYLCAKEYICSKVRSLHFLRKLLLQPHVYLPKVVRQIFASLRIYC